MITICDDLGNCSAGFYCQSGAIDETGIGTGIGGACPVGYWCGNNTVTPVACLPGTYQPSTGASASSDCLPCPAGMYCAFNASVAPTGQCSAGYYCLEGSSTPKPTGNNGDVCPLGSYCPAQSAEPQPCPAGTFNNETTQFTCHICTEGYYCTGNQSSWSGLCPKGYYCPAGTQFATQYPCPYGTFNNMTGASAVSACTVCSPGQYCSSSGLSTPDGLCSEGFYCSERAITMMPVSDSTGGPCQAGTYCPAGSITPKQCDMGSYCAQNMLATVSGNCSAGAFCIGGAKVPWPVDFVTGYTCPASFYCTTGTTAPESCSVGTYSITAGSSNSSYCVACTPGQYCDALNASIPTGLCAAGFYCPGDQSVSNPVIFPCPTGSFCPTGSPAPTQCAAGIQIYIIRVLMLAGTYQDQMNQSSCKPCPAGSWCPSNCTTATVCPEGSYCPWNTSAPTQHLCPSGTFNNDTGASSLDDCHVCTAGYYCNGPGLTTPTSVCNAGFYCAGGATVSTQKRCPAGAYCPSGSSQPTPCPAGYSTNSTGNTSMTI